MDALYMLTTIIHLEGEWAFAHSFSAKSVSESQNISAYKARKHLKELRELGMIQRQGNLYMFTHEGWDITHNIIRASQKYSMFGKAGKNE